MKFFAVILDGITMACCVLGVGFLSGKELQAYLGCYQKVPLFAVLFFACTFCLRQFCSKNKCQSLGQFCTAMFGKLGEAFHWALALCAFVCLVTTLSGAQRCLEALLWNISLPAYSTLVGALGVALLFCGEKTTKIFNLASLCLATIALVSLAQAKGQQLAERGVSAVDTTLYALFNSVTLLSVYARLSHGKSAKQNLLATLVATAVLCAFACLLLARCNLDAPLPAFDNLTGFGKIAVIVACLCCSVNCVVTNLLPLDGLLCDVAPNPPFRRGVLICVAVATSLFGFDFLLKFGYLFVATVGAVVVAGSVIGKRKKPFR